MTVAIPELLHHTLKGLELEADWVGIRAIAEQRTRQTCRNGQPEMNHRSRDRGAMVEVMVQGQVGYGATNDLTVAGLQRAAIAAYHQAQAMVKWGLVPFPSSIRPPLQGSYHSPVTQPLAGVTPGEVNELLALICQGLKVTEQVVQTQASLGTRQVETWWVSSHGSQIYQNQSFLTLSFGVTAQDGPVVQTRTYNGSGAHCYQGGWEQLSPDIQRDAPFWAAVAQVGQEGVALLAAADCPHLTTTLVLAPDQMMLQIHESIGHPLELDRILGDERNYAGGSFVKPEDFGQLQYGSPLLNVTFDPTVPGEFASYGFDDTGAKAERQYLIRQGKLERGLGSLESQARLGVPGVACARASSWDRPPIDLMANINVEPGDLPFSDLIATIKDGVYMTANRSWSIDDQRYKFQFGCEYGRRIRDGQLAEVVRNPNYRATTPQFWRNLGQVGDRSTWQTFGTPSCGKGEPNQLIQVGHGAPVCAFQGIEVFGGAG